MSGRRALSPSGRCGNRNCPCAIQALSRPSLAGLASFSSPYPPSVVQQPRPTLLGSRCPSRTPAQPSAHTARHLPPPPAYSLPVAPTYKHSDRLSSSVLCSSTPSHRSRRPPPPPPLRSAASRRASLLIAPTTLCFSPHSLPPRRRALPSPHTTTHLQSTAYLIPYLSPPPTPPSISVDPPLPSSRRPATPLHPGATRHWLHTAEHLDSSTAVHLICSLTHHSITPSDNI